MCNKGSWLDRGLETFYQIVSALYPSATRSSPSKSQVTSLLFIGLLHSHVLSKKPDIISWASFGLIIYAHASLRTVPTAAHVHRLCRKKKTNWDPEITPLMFVDISQLSLCSSRADDSETGLPLTDCLFWASEHLNNSFYTPTPATTSMCCNSIFQHTKSNLHFHKKKKKNYMQVRTGAFSWGSGIKYSLR